jgi:hypothetical protein
MGEGFFGRLILLEPRHGWGLIFRQIALWVDRRLPAFW